MSILVSVLVILPLITFLLVIRKQMIEAQSIQDGKNQSRNILKDNILRLVVISSACQLISNIFLMILGLKTHISLKFVWITVNTLAASLASLSLLLKMFELCILFLSLNAQSALKRHVIIPTEEFYKKYRDKELRASYLSFSVILSLVVVEAMGASLVFANLMGLRGLQIKLETIGTCGKIVSLVEFAICVIAFVFVAFMKAG